MFEIVGRRGEVTCAKQLRCAYKVRKAKATPQAKHPRCRSCRAHGADCPGSAHRGEDGCSECLQDMHDRQTREARHMAANLCARDGCNQSSPVHKCIESRSIQRSHAKRHTSVRSLNRRVHFQVRPGSMMMKTLKIWKCNLLFQLQQPCM